MRTNRTNCFHAQSCQSSEVIQSAYWYQRYNNNNIKAFGTADKFRTS
jgi:hypothetical protein